MVVNPGNEIVLEYEQNLVTHISTFLYLDFQPSGSLACSEMLDE
jgi:hypothetical protein